MTPSAPIPFREKLAYGVGDGACNLFWKTFTVFLMYFYTDVFGLTAATVGTMFLVTRLWDSIYDGTMGLIADRTSSRWGKFRPYLLWTSIPFGVFGILVFTVPHSLETSGRLVYAYVTYTLVMLAYSTINVPYGALLGVLSANSNERTSLSAYRFMFAFGGSLLVQKATLPLVELLGRGDNARGFQLAFAVWAVLAVVLFLLCFAGTRERITPPPGQRTPWRRDLADLRHNVPWVVVLSVTLIVQVAMSVRDGSIIYYFKYYMNDTALASNFMVSGSAAAIAGILIIPRVARRLGKKHTFLLLLIACAAAMSANYLVHPRQIGLVFAIHIAVNLCLGPTMVVISAMKADTVDYSEWRNHRRATGLIFSAASMASKLGWAFGGALTAWMLSAFGFHANVLQTLETQQGIRLMMSLLPAAITIAGALVTCLYPLTEPAVQRMEDELLERRKHV